MRVEAGAQVTHRDALPHRRFADVLVFGLVSGFLLLPAAPFVRFDGLPLSSLPELTALAVLVLVAVTPQARAVVQTRLGAIPEGVRLAIIGGLFVVCALKILTFVAAPTGEFRSCFSSRAVSENAAARCAPSYEAPFPKGSATRTTPTIDFGARLGGQRITPRFAAGTSWGDPNDRRQLSSTNWNLAFLNSNAFHAAWPPASSIYPDVERVPFEARFDGRVAFDERTRIIITYVGKGRVRIGDRFEMLPRSNAGQRVVKFTVPRGDARLVVEFAFDDGFRAPVPDRLGPYAALRVEQQSRGGETTFVSAQGPGLAWRAMGMLADVVGFLIVLSAIASFVVAVRLLWRWFLLALVLLAFATVAARPPSGFGLPALPISVHALVLVGLFVAMLWKRRDALIPVGIPAAMFVSAHEVLQCIPGLDRVLYRPGGDDWLTYQAFAFQIFGSHSLQGGESVFYYQPGFRYLVFVQHLLLGEGDAVPAITALVVLLGSVFVVTRYLVGRRDLSVGAVAICGLAGAGLLLVFLSAPIRDLVLVGASEWPTWLLIPAGLWLLFSRMSVLKWSMGAAALGSAVLMRPNQLIGVVVLICLFVLANARLHRARSAAVVGLFVAILLLPALHNAWYGDVLRFTPTGATTVQDLPPERIVHVFDDPDVRRQLREKVAAWSYLTPSFARSDDLGLAIVALIGAWLATATRLLRRRDRWLEWSLVAWPIAFVLHSLFFDVEGYYPRHIVVFYVSVGAVVLLLQGGVRLPHARSTEPDAVDPVHAAEPAPGT